MLGLRFCARAFSSCGERGPLFIAVRGPLTITASLVAEHRLQTRRLSNCGSRAQLLCGTWDLPRPGLEPVFPALAGRFSTTAPPGKPGIRVFNETSKRKMRQVALKKSPLVLISKAIRCALHWLVQQSGHQVKVHFHQSLQHGFLILADFLGCWQFGPVHRVRKQDARQFLWDGGSGPILKAPLTSFFTPSCSSFICVE